MSLEISRRRFLQLAGAGAAGMALAGCVSPAAAPSGAQPDAAAQSLIFSSYTWSGYEAAMRDVINAWNAEHPDVSVEQQYIAEDYWTKVQTQVAGGTPPDVGIADYGRMIVYAKDGVLLNLEDWIQRDSFPLDKMFPGAVAQYRWVEGDFDSGGEGGGMYGLPSDGQSHIIAYNKNMFDEAGIPYPTDDWTWDDLVEMAKAITKSDENKWGMQVISPDIVTKGNFLFSADGANHSADLKQSLIDSPESLEAWKWIWDLVYTHQVAPQPGAQAQTNPFMSGQVAMVVAGVWWIADYANITEFEWDVALYPKHPRTGRRTTSLESDGWWVFKSTAQPDLSWSLLQNLADEAGQKRFGELNYIIPSCFPEIGQEWYSRTPPENRLKVLDNIVEESHKVDFTYYDFFTCFDAYIPPIQAAFADGTDIEAACVEAAAIHNEELAAAWERFQEG